jgi:thiol-disulfide isomerase/thioredoxin
VSGSVASTGAAVILLLVPLHAVAVNSGDKLIGTKPPEWQFTDWLNSRPLTLQGLKGKVVLIRWWTAPGCPYCAATAPALNEFYVQYKNKGLVIIGAYHHKSDTALDPGNVKRSAERLGFRFPVAVDIEWKTLHRWWLDDHNRAWTSVSFLIDRTGVIRHIHPGGSYVKGDKDYAALKSKIEELLSEPTPPATVVK